MSENKIKLIVILGIITMCITCFSCASTNMNLINTGSINLEKVNYRNIRISNVFIQRQVDEIKISGKVKNYGIMHVSNGHVDISIISKEGDILKEMSTMYIPSNINVSTRRHSHGSRFSVKLPFIPPEGSIVRIAFHKNQVKKNVTFNCGENRASQKNNLI